MPKKSFSVLVVNLIVSLLIFLGFKPILWASPEPYKVPLKMERPEFWLKKIKNPKQILLTLDQIQKMNDEHLKKPELYLCNVR